MVQPDFRFIFKILYKKIFKYQTLILTISMAGNYTKLTCRPKQAA
jgi:hypothetical protein